MPTIPTFDAQIGGGIVSQPKATADTGLAQGLEQVGRVAQDIGNTLAEIRDRGQVVDAQLNFERGIAQLDDKYRNDFNFGTARARRADDVNALSENIQDGLSDNAKRALQDTLKQAVSADEIRFNGETFKKEGQYRVGEWEQNKDEYTYGYVFAKTDEDREVQRQKIQAKIQTLTPFMNPEVAAKYEQKFFNTLDFNRFSEEIPDRLSQGLGFDEERYKGIISPQQILQLRAKYKSEKSSLKSKVTSEYNELIQKHDTIYVNKGIDDGLADKIERMGDPKLAAQIRADDTVRKVVYDASVVAGADLPDDNLGERYNKIRSQLQYDKDDPLAFEKQKALDMVDRMEVAQAKAMNNDPTTIVNQYIKKSDTETNSQWASRVKEKTVELTGSNDAKWNVLTKGQQQAFKDDITGAQKRGDGEEVKALMEQLDSYGEFKHKVLSEIGLNGDMHIAMTAKGNKQDAIFYLSQQKNAKSVNKDYDYDEFEDDINALPFVVFLQDKVARFPSDANIKMRDDIIELAHKWKAYGGDFGTLFDHYNPARSKRINGILSQGIDPDVFDNKANTLLKNVDWDPYISQTRANRERYMKKVQENSYLVNADPTDSRLEKGSKGFYVFNPFTGGKVVDLTTEKALPLLIREDDVMATTAISRKGLEQVVSELPTYADIPDVQ